MVYTCVNLIDTDVNIGRSAFYQFTAVSYWSDDTHGHGQTAVSVREAVFYMLFHLSQFMTDFVKVFSSSFTQISCN